MTQSSACRKVTSLLALYIDEKLDEETKAFVEKHLQICPECNKKYIMLKELIYELRNAYQQLNYDVSAQDTKQQQFNIKEHENFQTNLSAYFDNELPLNESLSMKKYMIKYPKARKELESLYNLHSVIISSFNNTKRYLNSDYAKIICYRLQGKNYNVQKQKRLKIASYVASILLALTILFYTSPVGKTVINKSIEFFKKNIYVSSPSNIGIVTENN